MSDIVSNGFYIHIRVDQRRNEGPTAGIGSVPRGADLLAHSGDGLAHPVVKALEIAAGHEDISLIIQTQILLVGFRCMNDFFG